MSDSPLVVRGLTKSFGDKHVLTGVDLELHAGELVGFVGPNGAGKSTCLRILLGLVYRDSGAVRVTDHDPGQHGTAVRSRCSYLPGETSLYLGMRGREFLDFAWGFYPGRNEALIEEMQDTFGLPLRRKLRHYSAGMKQQLALLASLTVDADLFLLDEPDRALDATTRLFVRDVLRRLSKNGKTLLLSSHHLSEIEALADRLVFLLDGRCVEDSRVAAARDQLRKRVRLRLRPGAELPSGVDREREPDGTLSVQPPGDPMQWLATLEPQSIESAEIGVVKLEELYRALTTEGETR